MSMLEGAPWLLAHKSMLAVNRPMKVSLYGKDLSCGKMALMQFMLYLMCVRTWAQPFLMGDVSPQKMALAKWFVLSMH